MREAKTCRVDGCRSKHRAKGYCNKHYKQIQKHGRLTPELETCGDNGGLSVMFDDEIGVISGKCRIRGCTERAFAKHVCKLHYIKMRYEHIQRLADDDEGSLPVAPILESVTA